MLLHSKEDTFQATGTGKCLSTEAKINATEFKQITCQQHIKNFRENKTFFQTGLGSDKLWFCNRESTLYFTWLVTACITVIMVNPLLWNEGMIQSGPRVNTANSIKQAER